MVIEGSRYSRVAVWMHWSIGLLLLAQIVFGFVMDDLAPRGTPARTAIINLHKSTGIVLGLLIVARLAWRLAHRPPAWPAAMASWQRSAARLGHMALYLCMLLMPLSGYVASNFSQYGIKFFGHAWPAWGPNSPDVYKLLTGVHDTTAWIFALLIAGHVAVALKHLVVDKDGVFSRMWTAGTE